ncbi:amidohydrolase family protein [Chloroflexota bacterium]
MKIDVFSHIVPRKYWDTVIKRIGTDRLNILGAKEALGVELTRTLWKMDERFQIMDKYDDLVHILTPSGPPLELIATPEEAVELAKLYNDEMAELVKKYPRRFFTAVACLPLNNIDAALREAQRTIEELGFKGVHIYTPIYDGSPARTKPIDLPELMPLYEMMSNYGLPIWIHPKREYSTPDYTTEDTSKYVIHQLFGWPYETTVAMARLVFSGVLGKYPNIKFITHHCGAMVPYLVDRIQSQCEWYEIGLKANFLKKLSRPPLEYFHSFYNDTAICGNTPGLMCGYAFFGAEHMLFGTDFPYDAELGDKYTRDVIQAIEQMDIQNSEKQMIFEQNIKSLLNLG